MYAEVLLVLKLFRRICMRINLFFPGLFNWSMAVVIKHQNIIIGVQAESVLAAVEINMRMRLRYRDRWIDQIDPVDYPGC